jgi:hypothetical protein
MEVILKVTVLFTLVLALSFLIERLMEILKAAYDLLDSKFDWFKFWTRRTAKLAEKLEKKLRIFEYVKPKEIAKLFRRFREIMLGKENGYDGTLPVLSGDLIRAFSLKVFGKILGMLIGIGLAFWMHLDLIIIWQGHATDKTVWDIAIQSENLRIAITGIIMGMGSGPVHQFIRAVEKKRELKTEGEAAK